MLTVSRPHSMTAAIFSAPLMFLNPRASLPNSDATATRHWPSAPSSLMSPDPRPPAAGPPLPPKPICFAAAAMALFKSETCQPGAGFHFTLFGFLATAFSVSRAQAARPPMVSRPGSSFIPFSSLPISLATAAMHPVICSSAFFAAALLGVSTPAPPPSLRDFSFKMSLRTSESSAWPPSIPAARRTWRFAISSWAVRSASAVKAVFKTFIGPPSNSSSPPAPPLPGRLPSLP
mmetsp:Transcript_6546/g.16365  ORF Transcript_6546/g.16365 Transcript_6546/m.16365 type:complete len:233 (-) Transcript_6546:901-1599(-)